MFQWKWNLKFLILCLQSYFWCECKLICVFIVLTSFVSVALSSGAHHRNKPIKITVSEWLNKNVEYQSSTVCYVAQVYKFTNLPEVTKMLSWIFPSINTTVEMRLTKVKRMTFTLNQWLNLLMKCSITDIVHVWSVKSTSVKGHSMYLLVWKYL